VALGATAAARAALAGDGLAKPVARDPNRSAQADERNQEDERRHQESRLE
tara:strand:- start:23 stop:172 length:150 start_codon:yes stop_codon:yes gene_type:complete